MRNELKVGGHWGPLSVSIMRKQGQDYQRSFFRASTLLSSRIFLGKGNGRRDFRMRGGREEKECF